MNLHVQWAGHPVLRAISAAEAQPVSCGSLPCVGGQNEIVAVPGGLESTQDWQRLRVSARRTEQEYWLLTGGAPGCSRGVATSAARSSTRRWHRSAEWGRRLAVRGPALVLFQRRMPASALPIAGGRGRSSGVVQHGEWRRRDRWDES